ncbi:MAG: 50S ribosomal protein L10 [Candidatus Zambryskibacteria bacterium]|nr:50S ribosomal protein L10 [Candidatus Zambryskibacteria bacterium]
MAITKEKKKEIVSNLEKIIADSGSVVFVNFHGLLVSDASSLRRSLIEDKVGFLVTKKTLLKKVLNDSKIEGEIPDLEGELALSFGRDSIAPARDVYKFQKELGKVSILGGIFEGKYKSKKEMTEIASIPSLEILRGMFVNVINSPIQRFAISLNEITKIKN